MERKLAGYEPERVLYYFEELCKIPHGSGNTGAISDYCASFARERGLRYIQDETGNVIIFKPASAGYEKASAVILQGHLDMVAEKTPDSSHDFLRDGLDLFVEEDWIGARDTTLGGDDGIAVAYALAILGSDTILHPPLECVFTIDEETGMDGAQALDTSVLAGRYLINLDSENEGTVLASCTGGPAQELCAAGGAHGDGWCFISSGGKRFKGRPQRRGDSHGAGQCRDPGRQTAV